MEDQVVHQSKVLCRDFIVLKLKENGLINNDIYNIYNDDPNIIGQGHSLRPTDVSKEIISIASILECRYPRLFDDIGSYLKVTYQSTLHVQSVYDSVATELFKGTITWARIVALFVFTADLTVDCVKQKQDRFASVIAESLERFVHKKLAFWIVQQGGWPSLLDHFQESQQPKWHLWTVTGVGAFIGLLLGLILS